MNQQTKQLKQKRRVKRDTSPYELGKEFFADNLRTKPTRDRAGSVKQLLREHFRRDGGVQKNKTRTPG